MYIMDNWEDIGERIEDGSYATYYSIGDTKDLDINMDGKPQTIKMQIAAFDEDNLFDTTGKAAITWISKDVIAHYPMNATPMNRGGWMLSLMRRHYIQQIYNGIDIDARQLIKPVRKTSYHSDTNSEHTTKDYCWIPSVYEIYGINENCGPTYSTLFADDASLRKDDIFNSRCSWWLRSCSSGDNGFRCVGLDGGNYGDYANNKLGMVLGFCT